MLKLLIKNTASIIELCIFNKLKKMKMKKLLLTLLVMSFGFLVIAQEKDKVKKTSTPMQKVHNTFSKHKKYKGYKVKHKHHGVTKKHKVDYKEGEVKDKTK